MNFRDVKIGTKLFGSFFIILLFMSAISVFCLRSIKNIEIANSEIINVTLAELNLARGRQDSLRLIYTGDVAYGDSAQGYLTEAIDTASIMLEKNTNSRIYNKDADFYGKELIQKLKNYQQALAVIMETNLDKERSVHLRDLSSDKVNQVFSGLESFVIKTTDDVFFEGELELGHLLLTQNLVHIYNMTGLWDRMTEYIGKYDKSKSLDDKTQLMAKLDEMISYFDRADAIFTTDIGRQAIQDVRIPYNEYRNQVLSYIKANESQTVAISNAVEAGQQAAETANIVSEVLLEIASETSDSANFYTLIFSLSALALGFILSFAITRRITKPILKSVAYAQSLSGGDFTVTLELNQKDEVGTLGMALEDMEEKIKNVLQHIQDSSHQVTGASSQISQSAQTISVGATEQASSMEEVSSSLEELTSNIQQNTHSAKKSSEAADNIKRDTSDGVKAVRETVNAMREIGERIGIIEDIARNTNMLALNAAIEAARAGESGKGFAVVASEVKKLAENSGRAAKVITEIARENIGRAEQALAMIEAIIPTITMSAELSDEIALSSEEQTKGAEQISLAVTTLDQVVQQNASASEELASMAEELEAQARSMNEAVSYFKLGREGELKENHSGKQFLSVLPVFERKQLSKTSYITNNFEEF